MGGMHQKIKGYSGDRYPFTRVERKRGSRRSVASGGIPLPSRCRCLPVRRFMVDPSIWPSAYSRMERAVMSPYPEEPKQPWQDRLHEATVHVEEDLRRVISY